MKYEINKYPPSLFKHARFLREDWIACSDIGQVRSRGTLEKQEYLRVEGRYVAAVTALAGTIAPDLLQVHDVEFWEVSSEHLERLGLADVLDGTAAPVEAEPIAISRLDNLVRRCLREAAWLELIVAQRLLRHIGYDMRLIVASSMPLTEPLAQIRASGLFVYDSDAPLSTF